MSKTNYMPYKVKDIFPAEWGRKSQMVSKILEFELFNCEKSDYFEKIKQKI
jgi:hypothetical protein